MGFERIRSKDPVKISADASVLEAAKLMQSKHVGFLVVIEDSHPIGILTEKDIVRKVVANEERPAEVAVENIIDSPRMVNAAYDVLDGARLMHEMDNFRGKEIRHWLVECPFNGTLTDAYVGPRNVPLGRLIEIKSCRLWQKKDYCGQECLRTD